MANTDSNNVTKLDAATGSFIGTYSTGSLPESICSDGSNIWVGTSGSGSAEVTKLLASTGANIGTYTLGGGGASGICYDGSNIWVTDGAFKVYKVNASTGGVIGYSSTGNESDAVCFDGSSIWVTNYVDGTVSKLP